MQRRTYLRTCPFLAQVVANISITIRISATACSVQQVMFTVAHSPVSHNDKLFYLIVIYNLIATLRPTL